ncbi:hypothetical protein K8I31_02800, partial [bacterium]|nr:hypothetical protein [bacterium]
LLAFAPLLGWQGFGESEKISSPRRNRGGYFQNTSYRPSDSHSAIQASSENVDSHSLESNDINGFRIRGRTTLKEIEISTGVSINAIATALNLPDGLPENERLSILMEKYGLDMIKVRETVKRLATK